MSNFVTRKDKVARMREVKIEKRSEDFSTEEHEYSDDDKLSIGKDLHVNGGHGRYSDCGD